MSPQSARNIGVIVVLGLVVWLAPGGGEGAGFVLQLLSAIFIVLVAVGCGLLYRNHRTEIHMLGDTWRFGVYAAVGVALVTLAASGRMFETGAGILLWLALLAGSSYVLYLAWQRHRAY